MIIIWYVILLLLLGEFHLIITSNSTCSSSRDQTDLSTCWLASTDGCWFTDMLMVTTTMRMFDWIHTNTSNFWEHLSLWFEHIMLNTSLQDWFFISTPSSDYTQHSS